MKEHRTYELVVIGGGSAGSTAAKWAAKRDIPVALVERDRLGGTCLNYGCDPTKALLHAAGILHAAKRADSFGLRFPEAGFDWSAVVGHVRDLIAGIRGGTPEQAAERQQRRGIDVFRGEASFVSPREVRIDDTTIAGERFLIATGFEPVIPPIDGIEQAGYITNREAVTLERLPRTLAVVGAGPVGVEFAQVFSRFGARVTLFDMNDRILFKDEADLANELAECLQDEGVQIRCGSQIKRVAKQDSGDKQLVWKDSDGEHSIDVEEILIASGRKPAIEALQLENAGVETKDGALVLDETLRSSVPSIWAAGDITRRFPFTHVASVQAVHAVRNAFSEVPEAFDYLAMPWVTYTDPALAHVGATTHQLESNGRTFETFEMALSNIPRNVITAKRAGRVRLLAEPDSGRLLGGHILGAGADELLAPVILAMRHGLPVQALADTVFPYPTSSAALQFAAKQFFK